MKLRNKETGEIGELQITEKHCAVVVGNGTASCETETYSSLAKLNEEWEDYEEKGWYITENGEVRENSSLVVVEESEYREIGNYFESEEEAEKAVEKLKAWKRLKDKGFMFDGWGENHHNLGIIEFSFPIVGESVWDFEKDLDLLFGGEE